MTFNAGGKNFEVRSGIVEGMFRAEVFEADGERRGLTLGKGLIDPDVLQDVT